MSWSSAVYIAIGGACGACTRYALNDWIMSRTGTYFPWGVLVINITGSFCLGLFIGAREVDHLLRPMWSELIAVGFLGAYTTFSTFAVDTLKLCSIGANLAALLNVMASIVVGIGAALGGVLIGRSL